ncbi:unnamed protein product [Angiostrongylus costaricensis]|uniref:Uncharacterized protein n=1 Tax=Angiostrongylus costaricensis TaxID=334426 RepID=A0A0R3PS58_ANGCS|nr:unnamed protein product [Angiostrongylus costaricensis]
MTYWAAEGGGRRRTRRWHHTFVRSTRSRRSPRCRDGRRTGGRAGSQPGSQQAGGPHALCFRRQSVLCCAVCCAVVGVRVFEEASQPASKRACFAVCTTRMMLSPIITKDMKLFPSRPLPAGIKNVRSRAQSLDHFNQMQSSGSARGRVVTVKPRSSQSTGNLPAFAASSTSGSMTSRSPPKTIVHRKTTLTAIQEGVEMGHNHHHPNPNANANALRDDRHTER